MSAAEERPKKPASKGTREPVIKKEPKLDASDVFIDDPKPAQLVQPEQVAMPEESVAKMPELGKEDISVPSVATTDSDSENLSSQKRTREEEIDEKIAKKRIVSLSYVPWRLLTKEIILECCKFSDLYTPPSKAGLMKIMFDYDKFAKLHPECPPISPPKSKVLYVNFPLMKSSFGYWPYIDTTTAELKVVNQLRFEFDDFDICKEAKEFKEFINKEWTIGFAMALFENRRKLKDRYLEIRCKVEKGKEIQLEDVIKAFRPIVREPENSSFGDYLQFRLSTIRANEKLGIEGDNYTAFIKVWKHVPEEDTGKRKLLAKQLLKKNGGDYDGLDANPIFVKGMYGEGIVHFEHYSFTKEAAGLSMDADTIIIGTREELAATSVSEDGQEEECPM